METPTLETSCRSKQGKEIVGRWRSAARRCRDLAVRGQAGEAEAEFAELNRQMAQFLSAWRKPGGEFEALRSELDRLLDEVISWRDDPATQHLAWTWRFHHALLAG